MRLLALTSSISAAEARWIDALRASGHTLEIFDVAHGHWVDRRSDHPVRRIPGWLDALALRRAGNAVSTFHRALLAGDRYDGMLTFGLAAGGTAGRHQSRPFHPILFSGDLDFTSARVSKTEDFLDLTRSAPTVLLQDEYEFDKALSKNSQSAHLLHPTLRAQDRGSILSAESHAAPHVALLHPEGMPVERVAALDRLIRPEADRAGAELTVQSISALYRHRDAVRHRGLVSTMRTRLNGVTHVVIVGSSRDHLPIVETLLDSGAGQRMVVEDTIAAQMWSQGRYDHLLARGGRLGSQTARILGDTEHVAEPEQAAPTDPWSELIESTSSVPDRTYEQIRAREGDGPLQVFFSTTPLEDSTAGARPQRVRNMELALRRRGDTVRVPSSPMGFARRTDQIRAMLGDGRRAATFYGENSTSPIPDETIASGLAEFLTDWRAAGGVSGWFVRDLHWLDPQGKSYVDDPASHAEMVQRGLRELNLVGAASDVLFAPSVASLEGFGALLEGHEHPDTVWRPLPPGVAAENVVESSEVRGDQITLLYAGGLGDFYTMESYLAALSSLERRRFTFDFVVRQAEVDRLEVMLDAHGLADDARVRIMTDDFDVYRPGPGRTVGTVLLDSDYARFSFPYKTMSFLEKGFPLLTFRDMALAQFVEETGVGEVCDRDTESIVMALERISVSDYTEAIATAQRDQSWDARVDEVVRSTDERGGTRAR